MASVTQDKYVVEFEYYCENYLFQTNETNDYYLYKNENKMFESDKEDEGMSFDENISVVFHNRLDCILNHHHNSL